MNKFTKLSIACLTLSLAACGSIFGPMHQRKVTYYDINDTSVKMPASTCSNSASNILYVSPMRANAPYDTTKMYYAEKPFELNTYAYSQWAAMPTDLLTQSITKRLITSCLYRDIANSNALADANYRLVTQLVSLRQDITSNTSATNHLVIYAQLVNLNNNKVVASRAFEESASSAVGPEEMVLSVNQLLTQFGNDLIAWLSLNNK